MIRKLVKTLYPWIKIGNESWPHIATILKEYKPRLHQCCKVKCNTDGVCRGNPGKSSLAFCARDERGDLIYAAGKGSFGILSVL